MTKMEIRDAYRIHDTMGYDTAIFKLMQMGMTEVQADNYLLPRSGDPGPKLLAAMFSFGKR